AKISTLSLTSQFRCNGSDGYLAWLDDVLGIRETANATLSEKDYDFKIVESPNELRDIIFEKNKIKNKARLVAGYCWDWISKTNSNAKDIVIPEYKFEMKWNLASDGNLWIRKPEAVSEIGCIHTCQGLDLDYVGVIVGPDLIVRGGKVVTDPSKRAKTDASLKGYKKDLAGDREVAKKKADAIIKNTYRTLMTRGMKGCYVYFVDKETEKFFKSRIEGEIDQRKTLADILPAPIFATARIPLVGSAPCGNPLLGKENIEEYIDIDERKLKSGYKYFILRAMGDSMNLAGINDGDLVLCRQQLKADTGDRVVALLGDNVTIKMYDKKDGRRILLPKSTNKNHVSIMPSEDSSVQGIVQEVLN
ncbi:MAG TPA: DNA/RNA helicase domain-containing protein, partial [Candidatus Paceibacterota bacterium]|nr:DNA/RNA helicase domain-containing protein [Candidatus Paceibacterota bacterium]